MKKKKKKSHRWFRDKRSHTKFLLVLRPTSIYLVTSTLASMDDTEMKVKDDTEDKLRDRRERDDKDKRDKDRRDKSRSRERRDSGTCSVIVSSWFTI